MGAARVGARAAAAVGGRGAGAARREPGLKRGAGSRPGRSESERVSEEEVLLLLPFPFRPGPFTRAGSLRVRAR